MKWMWGRVDKDETITDHWGALWGPYSLSVVEHTESNSVCAYVVSVNYRGKHSITLHNNINYAALEKAKQQAELMATNFAALLHDEYVVPLHSVGSPV